MATSPQPSGETLQGNFVFQGTVSSVKAATEQIPVSDQTIIVRVDRLIAAPAALSDYAGREITVQLAQGESVETGQTLIFHTNGWIFGASLAVKSVGLQAATPTAIAAATLQPDDPVQNLHLRHAKDQAKSADLIVSGRVSSIRLPSGEAVARTSAMSSGRTREPISEHAPLWQEAVVDIDAVHKGQYPNKQVVIRFPTSSDVRWRHAPRFQVGQEGVFLLHSQQLDRVPTAMTTQPLGPNEFTALNPGDFQSLDVLHHLI